jgi:hypothetical protein
VAEGLGGFASLLRKVENVDLTLTYLGEGLLCSKYGGKNLKFPEINSSISSKPRRF